MSTSDEPVSEPDNASHAPGLGPRGIAGSVWHVIVRTATKAWDNSIFSQSAAAAFWQTLSLPPLLLGVLGSIGYVAGWIGPDTLAIIERRILTLANAAFSDNVVSEIIAPTVSQILQNGRGEVISFGFVLSLWAGSSAVSTFVDSIVLAHGQQDARHPVWQRIFALLLYVAFLVLAVVFLPLVAVGPNFLASALPEQWYEMGSQIVRIGYYPAVGMGLILGLTTLYKVALHRSLPWHRLLGGAVLAGVVFMIASSLLRVYLSWVTSTGYTYGALASPIAFLLFTFFLGLAVILGAEFNAAIEETWPAPKSKLEQVKGWISDKAGTAADPALTAAVRRLTGPIRLTREDAPDQSPGRNPS